MMKTFFRILTALMLSAAFAVGVNAQEGTTAPIANTGKTAAKPQQRGVIVEQTVDEGMQGTDGNPVHLQNGDDTRDAAAAGGVNEMHRTVKYK